MKLLGYWIEKRETLRRSIQKLELEVSAKKPLRSTMPLRIRMPDKAVRKWAKPPFNRVREWRRSYNAWRKRAKAYSNLLRQLDAMKRRLDYILDRIRILTKTKSQYLKEDPFT